MGRTVLWIGLGLLVGISATGLIMHRVMEPKKSPETVNEPTIADDEGTTTPTRTLRLSSPQPSFVVNELYTSPAAEEKAYIQRLKEDAEVRDGLSDAELLAQLPNSFAGLFDSVENGEDVPVVRVNPPEETVEPETEPDDGLSPEERYGSVNEDFQPTAAMNRVAQREVGGVVEGFLRDAFKDRDVEAYLSALDEDLRYTFDGGTPNNPVDDVQRRGLRQERAAIERLFDRFDETDVRLSRARNFQLMQPDVAQVSYDYDIRLRNDTEATRIGGTAIFLLVRGGTRGNTDDWRIVEWYDSPPRPRTTR